MTLSGCLQSSPTRTSPGKTDHAAFSAGARAQGYLGTWSVIALRSLPAALKISTPPQHTGTPIFIQKCIWEAEAKTSTGCCGLEKSYYRHCRENKGKKGLFGHLHGIVQAVGCSARSVAGARTPAWSWGSGSQQLRSILSLCSASLGHFPKP